MYLVTAGPTREFLDDVRFLSNPSTGRMGFACAEAAALAGHDVVLVTGPVELADPAGVEVVRVVSAVEMHRAAMKACRTADVVIATAAVSDYRPASRAKGKIAKGPARMTLALAKNPDILAEMGAKKGRRVLIGFALEVQKARERALAKYRAKNLDAIVVNSPETFASDSVKAVIHLMDDEIDFEGTKRELAATLVALAKELADVRALLSKNS
jgi:phosphopantothenoylcysteine decarboxylase/phosphopantothenate--cysteine ligase